jgi:Holliday junction DNA helicase RuvA
MSIYAYIKGTLVEASPSIAIVETNGIGYQICIPLSVYSKLPPLGNSLLLHTTMIVREDSQCLYGFLNKTDKELYELLLSVSGIGPKLGLALTGHIDASELQQAIVQGDIVALSRVPGVGKRTAERLILELKDKIMNFTPRDPIGKQSMESGAGWSALQRDAVSALINLGYTQAVATKAVKKTLQESDKQVALTELITCSLGNV